MDEEGEQYETYFFSVVDEADLLAAAEAAGVEQAACSCSEKCEAGPSIRIVPVCSVNMSKCVGLSRSRGPRKPRSPPRRRPSRKRMATQGMLLPVLAVAWWAAGGVLLQGAAPKQQKAAAPQEDYGDELTDYDEPDGYGDGDDDGPPWDEGGR